METFKTIFAILFLAVTLTSCGNDDDANDNFELTQENLAGSYIITSLTGHEEELEDGLLERTEYDSATLNNTTLTMSTTGEFSTSGQVSFAARDFENGVLISTYNTNQVDLDLEGEIIIVNGSNRGTMTVEEATFTITNFSEEGMTLQLDESEMDLDYTYESTVIFELERQ